MKSEIREQLERPFDKKYIKQRKGNFGATLDYIEGDKVIQRLNDCLGSDWSFEILTPPAQCLVNDHVVVHGRMILRDANGNVVISKEQFGGKKVTKSKSDGSYLDLAADMKSSATDCLKKCATLLGVALDLYGTDEKEAVEKAPSTLNGAMLNALSSAPTPAPVTTPPVPETPKVEVKANRLQLSAIRNLLISTKKNEEEVKLQYKVTTLEDLTETNAKEVIVSLNKVKG